MVEMRAWNLKITRPQLTDPESGRRDQFIYFAIEVTTADSLPDRKRLGVGAHPNAHTILKQSFGS